MNDQREHRHTNTTVRMTAIIVTGLALVFAGCTDTGILIDNTARPHITAITGPTATDSTTPGTTNTDVKTILISLDDAIAALAANGYYVTCQNNGCVDNGDATVDFKVYDTAGSTVIAIIHVDLTTAIATVYYGSDTVPFDVVNLLTPPISRCPSGIYLPDGVDSMVCDGMPSGAITVTKTEFYGWEFQLPSKNIACYSDGTSVTCEIGTYTFTPPPEIVTACDNLKMDWGCNENIYVLAKDGTTTLGMFGGCDGPLCYITNEPSAPKVTTLQYGQTANFGSFACLSAEDGVTCWNVDNAHGYKMNMSQLLYW